MNYSYMFTNVAIVEIEEAYRLWSQNPMVFSMFSLMKKWQSYGIFVPVSGETFLDIEEIQSHMPVVYKGHLHIWCPGNPTKWS